MSHYGWETPLTHTHTPGDGRRGQSVLWTLQGGGGGRPQQLRDRGTAPAAARGSGAPCRPPVGAQRGAGSGRPGATWRGGLRPALRRRPTEKERCPMWWRGCRSGRTTTCASSGYRSPAGRVVGHRGRAPRALRFLAEGRARGPGAWGGRFVLLLFQGSESRCRPSAEGRPRAPGPGGLWLGGDPGRRPRRGIPGCPLLGAAAVAERESRG